MTTTRGSPLEELFVRHFLVCLGMDYDWGEPFAPYCLRNVLFRYGPGPGELYPLSISDLRLFARLEGEGDHELWVEVVRIGGADDALEDAADDLLAAYGPYTVRLGPVYSGLSRGWHVHGVPFPTPGWYEFRLTAADLILAREPIYLEDGRCPPNRNPPHRRSGRGRSPCRKTSSSSRSMGSPR